MENTNVEERYFDLKTVLSVTCRYLFTDMGDIYDILSYITNTEINVYNMLYSLRVAEFCILQKYPQLRGIDENMPLLNPDDAITFVNSQKAIFGESLAVSPISNGRHTNINETPGRNSRN